MELVTGAMGSLLPKLGELLKEEYNLQRGVRVQVEFLSRELEIIHAALRKMAEVPHKELDELVKLRARQVRELSYDIEDIIDTFLVRVEDGRDATPNPNKFEQLIKTMGNLFHNHQIADAIKEIKNQIQELPNRWERYNVNAIVATPAARSTIDPRLLAMYKDVSQLIGIHGPRRKLIKMLSDRDGASNKKMKIVSVVGIGGLGKTTLAKAVYDKLKASFDCCAFVSVGQHPDMKKVLKDILIDLDKQKDTDLNMTDEKHFIDKLREFLKNKRYLVVIDDIWAMPDWAGIRCALPDNNLEHRIIATTRHHDVAEQIGRVYNLQALSDAYSAKLFNERVFGGECPDSQMKKVSDKILKKCGGVPLAIVTIASLLNSKIKNTREWTKVHDSIGRGLLNGPGMEDMKSILSLSYYSLPPHLRTCLLYMSIFPEDCEIQKDQLIWLWIAEGFIQYGEQGETLYELAECYFNELINRSLIQPGGIVIDGRVKACRVHDMVLDLIRSLSTEENFVTVLDGTEKNTSLQRNVHRLSIQNTSKVTTSFDAMRMPQKLRSLIVFSSNAGIELLPLRFHSLRVLELGGCHVGEARHLNLGNLLQLRYLGLRGTGIQQLPGDTGKLKCLQTLDLGGNYMLEELPSTLVQLRQLMCLRVNGVLPDGIGSLASLEVLQGIFVNKFPDRVKELRKLTGLRELYIKLDGFDIDKIDGDSLQVDLAKSLSRLTKIHTLVLDSSYGCLDRFGECWVPPQHLVCLSITSRGVFSRMPACIEKNLPHLSDLSSLSIHVEQLRQEEDMQIIAELPALWSLWIEGYADGRLIIGTRGFRRLRKFYCRGVTPMFQGGAMPKVESVSFRLDVRRTKDDGNDGFETGLGNLRSLKDVKVYLWSRIGEAGEVKKAEDALRHAAGVNPNSPTLQIERRLINIRGIGAGVDRCPSSSSVGPSHAPLRAGAQGVRRPAGQGTSVTIVPQPGGRSRGQREGTGLSK